ncbi:MAG: S8 family serine peptidase [Candidatus Thorarchaeota archaeon]|nr:S8 family serine peptidase [Candidatus Thorarchaeota archaeon]
MKRTLILGMLIVSMCIIINPVPQAQQMEVEQSGEWLPLEEFIDSGEKEDVTVRFERELMPNEIAYYESKGIHFGDSPQHIGSVYIAQASKVALKHLETDWLFEQSEPLKQSFYQSPRDVSITDCYADLAWQMNDYFGENLTGEGILIADLDTGIQWRHPDFYFADGPSIQYFETSSTPPWVFNNGTDGVDLNGNYAIENNEKLYAIDVNQDGSVDATVDWIWLDNGTTVGSIDDGDTFFAVNDTDSNNVLGGVDYLVRLKTPKTKYLVHKIGGSIRAWERGVNLTSSTFYDTDGHGTGVAGILNGGQLGYRKYVGVAPDAELMAINIFGTDGLTVEEGLVWARDHGADVILIEVGSWTYEFLDGSSNVEMMIDTLTTSGIPVIVPAGNLQGGYRHAYRSASANAILSTDFMLNRTGYQYMSATEMYITVLCDQLVNNVQVNITEPTAYGSITHQLSFGFGYYQWARASTGTNVTIDTFIANSTRGSWHMIAIDISGVLYHNTWWSIAVNNTLTADYHFYISDDASAWSDGAGWSGSHGLTNQNTITWPSTADTAISVASYHTRTIPAFGTSAGTLAAFSSIGPRIDGNAKMSIAAPGGWDVISAWSSDSAWATWFDAYGAFALDDVFGGYRLFSGTSASGPHVAGAAALILQLNRDCGPIVKDIIEGTAYNDAFTGSIPPPPGVASTAWGYGKLNISKAIEETREIPVIWETTEAPMPPEYNETFVVTANITNADFVIFDWTHDDWSSLTHTNMTLSSGIYSASIPSHAYSTNIKYRIMPVNISAKGNPIVGGEYIVTDTIAPTIISFWNNATATVIDPTFVDVAIQASEPTNASGIWGVDIEFSVDNWINTNLIAMTFNGTHWIGTITPIPAPLTVKFRVAVYDYAMNRAVTSEVAYTVNPASTTTTTTTTTTSTTDTSTTTGTTTSTTGPLPPTTSIIDWLQENMTLVLAAGGILLLVIIILTCRKRR